MKVIGHLQLIGLTCLWYWCTINNMSKCHGLNSQWRGWHLTCFHLCTTQIKGFSPVHSKDQSQADREEILRQEGSARENEVTERVQNLKQNKSIPTPYHINTLAPVARKKSFLSLELNWIYQNDMHYRQVTQLQTLINYSLLIHYLNPDYKHLSLHV